VTNQRRSLHEFLGRKEDEHLEFKEPRALREPYGIAREVCAFLNSGGGELVIGIADDGAAVPVDRPEAEIGPLRDRLASLIAPSLPAIVRVEVLEGGGILLTVGPRTAGERGLFAVRSSKGRFGVFRRVQDRVVALDWAEAREAAANPRTGARKQPEKPAEKLLLEWRESLRTAGNSALERVGGVLAVWVLEPRLQDLELETNVLERIRGAIEDPKEVGLRSEGTNYSPRTPPQKKQHTFFSGSRDECYRTLEFDVRGVLRFATRLDTLLGDRVPGCPRKRTIYPLSLIETIVSCSVLFATLSDLPKASGTVGCALDLAGIDGYSLPPYHPRTVGWLSQDLWAKPHKGTALTEILKASLDFETFRENPHGLAHRLISWIYEEFGYGPHDLGVEGEKVPYWNASVGRFVFPGTP